MKKLLLILLCLIGGAHAGTIDTQYVSSIVSAAPGWGKILSIAATKIFLVIWFLDTAWQCISRHLFNVTHLKELFRFLAVRIIFFGFFSATMLFPEFYLGIIQWLVSLAQGSMGSIQGSSSSGMIGIDPGWIWQQYATWLTNDYTNTMLDVGGPLGVQHVGTQIGLAIANIIYLICTTYICFLIIMLQVQISVTVYGALILTGCAGSKWTESWWQSYLGAVVSIGIKVMLFCFLYAVLQNAMIYKPGIANADSVDVLTQIINCILCTLSLSIIPGKIAGIISSAGGGNFGGEAVAGFMGGLATARQAGSYISSTAGGAASITKSTGSMAASTISKITDKLNGLNNSKSDISGGSSPSPSTQPHANNNDKTNFLNRKD